MKVKIHLKSLEKKIPAIKTMRQASGMPDSDKTIGLKEAKDLVESVDFEMEVSVEGFAHLVENQGYGEYTVIRIDKDTSEMISRMMDMAYNMDMITNERGNKEFTLTFKMEAPTSDETVTMMGNVLSMVIGEDKEEDAF